MERKCSSLNPLANTFVPTSETICRPNFAFPQDLKPKESIRSVASYYIQKIIEVKRERGDYSLSKSEIVSLIRKLICLRYNISSAHDMLCIRSYLTDKVPNAVLLKLSDGDHLPSSEGNNSKMYDILTFKLPTPTNLLVAFCGLYRHEQAFRPMLSLACRSDSLKDKVWSVTDRDLKLWNASVERSCSCPPMFGYSIPSQFFGNPFNLSNLCSVNKVHMTCSEDNETSNEHILQDAEVHHIYEHRFKDFDEVVAPKSDLGYYSERLQDIISSVYNMIDNFENLPETENQVDEGYGSCENFKESLWSSNNCDSKMLIDYVEEDNNNHPLLNLEFNDIENEVSMEVKEIIRKSFSSESDADATNLSPSFRKPERSAPVSIDLTSRPLEEFQFSDPSFGLSRRGVDLGRTMSRWSSQEDVFEDVWNSFGGEDSMWLPISLSEKFLTHKRVRELQRQTFF